MILRKMISKEDDFEDELPEIRIRKTLKETWKLKNHSEEEIQRRIRSQKEAEFHLIPDLL